MQHILMQPVTSQYIIGVAFIVAGMLHFIKPGMYIQIMPDYIPWHKLMVYVSGAAEIAGGVGVLIPKTQFWAAWALIALLVAVFPANVEMAVQAARHQGVRSFYFMATFLRLPLQFVLIYWVYWACLHH